MRFVHLFDWGWDFHGTNPSEDIRDGLTQKAATFDRPAAALIDDLEQRGLLEDTLVLCMGEFGRTPSARVAPLPAKTSAVITIPIASRSGWRGVE